MSRRPNFADEQSARLDAIGLSTDDRIAANENAPTRSALYASVGQRIPSTDTLRSPGRLSKEQVIEHGNTDGYVDAMLGWPMAMAHRFCEANLYLENFDRFQVYADAYQAAYRKAVQK